MTTAQAPLFAEDEYIDEAQAAMMLGIHPASLRTYRRQQRGPELPYRQAGEAVQYRLADVVLEAQHRKGLFAGETLLSTAEAAQRLGVSQSLLRVKRLRGDTDLTWVRDGRRIWYHAADVAAYARRRAAARNGGPA